ncbi:MAG: hypothetical protein UW78_C0006G0107 [Candidatus Azambacteria bacterium GW2011_GWA1_44_9]|uniref:Transmembrane protein n=1 Tax=Candidatus Azambacteria bacterium GW2011_GWA1_44_9 TaxID=1618610 RepID=A0A0G1MLR8_9BACT|nr:MAG: hypothetical protein UW78_C0006G0107 [Candidatus Azambacteria bacterium GW2011_GWA1_44_9]
MKKFLVFIVLIGFIAGAILSFSSMEHHMDGMTSDNCPTTPLHTSTCPTGTLSTATHVLFMYQTFTNVLVSSFVAQVLMTILLTIGVLYVLQKYFPSISHIRISLRYLSRNYSTKLFRPQAITRWLSLFINSPSFN